MRVCVRAHKMTQTKHHHGQHHNKEHAATPLLTTAPASSPQNKEEEPSRGLVAHDDDDGTTTTERSGVVAALCIIFLSLAVPGALLVSGLVVLTQHSHDEWTLGAALSITGGVFLVCSLCMWCMECSK